MFRLKTIDELRSDGYAVTPAGDYIHANFETITGEMLAYGQNLSQEVLKIIFESMTSRCIDLYVYHSFHITKVDLKLCV